MAYRDGDAVEEKPSFASNPFFVAFVVTLLGAIAAAVYFWRASDAPVGETATLENGTIERSRTAPAVAAEPLAAVPAPEPEAAAEEVAATANRVEETGGGGREDETLAIRELPIGDVDTGDLVGGRIVLVSSAEPSVVVLDDGSRFAAGTEMPSGHVIASIERERIVLERDGVVSVLRLP